MYMYMYLSIAFCISQSLRLLLSRVVDMRTAARSIASPTQGNRVARTYT
jgi:hypothetical protein